MIRYFKKPKAYVVFSSEYLIGVSTYGSHHTFDIFKYKRIRDKLIAQKLLKAKNILYPKPCEYSDIKKIHSAIYIRKIQDPIYVNQALKIEINTIWDNSVLEYYKAVCGGTIHAAFKAIELNKPIFNLGGGFHHAQPEKAEGFCLLNDIAIAVKRVQEETKIKRVLIVDLDYHQGNGNTLIFKNDANVFTFSIHADKWIEEEAVSNLDLLVESGISEKKYMKTVEEKLDLILEQFKPEFIFYVAGSDPYELDELADMNISREMMLKRNVYILQIASKLNVPVVILPGGGYGEKSWKIYYDFISTAMKGNKQYV
ncbi:MAG: histone deacetylase [Calditrichaeota bacterium]|nr:MAG: histone deacetylase [Calditrichota bacterium]MBL1204432.1 histone deacetylase [Calditrichota bacterium]NOG44261.1 histone deacetylase [Calditrichota bacterium]